MSCSGSNCSNEGCEQNENASTRQVELEKPFVFSDVPTLNMLRQQQLDFVNERNWDQYHQPRNVLLALVGEVGELAELFQWKGECHEGLPDWTAKERTNLEHELSDVFMNLLRLAEKCHVDLPTVAAQKIELNKLKYPSHKVYGSCRKYTEYDGHA